MADLDTTAWADEPIFVRDAVFQPIDTPTAVDEVARRIRQAIVLGVLRDGDRLPAETDLAQRIGVGVMTVRAALSELRADGLLETHRGRLGGSFVASSDTAVQTGIQDANVDRFRDVAELLGGLEAHAALRATQLANEDEMAVLAQLVAELERSDDAREASIINNRFHLTIASASRNRLLVAEISQRRAEIYAAAFAMTAIRLPLMPDNDSHVAIFAAMQAGEGLRASELMWEHHLATMTEVLDAAQ